MERSAIEEFYALGPPEASLPPVSSRAGSALAIARRALLEKRLPGVAISSTSTHRSPVEPESDREESAMADDKKRPPTTERREGTERRREERRKKVVPVPVERRKGGDRRDDEDRRRR